MRKIYIHFGNNKLYSIKQVENSNRLISINKPASHTGLWASEYIADGKYKSSWEEWCVKEKLDYFDNSKYVLFSLNSSSKVLYINSIDDYYSINNRFKDKLGFLDWQQLRKGFDAVEVTKGADYWSTFEEDNAAYSFTFWDVPSIIVFRSSVIKLL